MKKLMFLIIILCFGFTAKSKADKISGKPISITHSIVDGKESLLIIVEKSNGQKYTIEAFFDEKEKETIYLRQIMVAKVNACINQMCINKKTTILTFENGLFSDKNHFTPAGSFYSLDGERLKFW